ncbi:MAG: hypothetical protein ACRDQH_04595 [Pseudonocardiaceae bacterium]
MVTAIAHLTGQGTTISLDANTVKALTSLGVTPSPFGTATLNGTNITFPITSGYAEIHQDKSFKPGYVVGSIQHDGAGLTLTKGSTVVTISNFVVDPGNSMLYGTVGGKPDVPIATLDGSALQVTTPGGAVHLDGTNVKLTDTAASALDKAFGTTAIMPGLSLGIAHIVATGTANTYTDKVTEVSRLTGTSTSVDLDAKTLAALTSLGVKPATVGSATLTGTTISFPITGGFAGIHSDKSAQPGYIVGSIIHQASGLSLTKGSTTVTTSDYVVNPGTSMLYATVSAGGKTLGYNVPLFFLDGSKVQTSMVNGTVHLDGTEVELTAAAASALNSAFGTNALMPNTPIGVAHIIVAGS